MMIRQAAQNNNLQPWFRYVLSPPPTTHILVYLPLFSGHRKSEGRNQKLYNSIYQNSAKIVSFAKNVHYTSLSLKFYVVPHNNL
jgi:hypothetical protein